MLTGRAMRYLSDSARAFERAPAEVTVAVCVAIAFSYAVEAGGDAMPRWFEVAITGVLIGGAAWTATLLHALGAWSTRTRWLVTLIGAVLAGLYGGLVIDLDRAAEGWRAAMLVGAAVLWLAAVPVFARRRGADAAVPQSDAVDLMRAVTGRFLLRVIGALLYCAALYAGLALALGAVNTLFELRLDNEIYAHVFGWIFFVLAPWIVIGGLPGYVLPVPERTEVATVVHRMTAFLVPPLLVIYYAILYAYTVRIAVTGEIPKNIVSPMVFAAGALALLALLLFDPRSRGPAGERTLRAAPPVFVPLAVLGVWTILLRVAQYGWTEFRLLRLLLLLAFGLLAVGASVQVLRHRRIPLHVAPLALAALLLVAAVGPWSVLHVSRSSQQARLAQALATAGVDETTVRPAPLPQPVHPDSGVQLAAATFDQINSTTHYLIRHFGPDALPPLLAAHAEESERSWNMAGVLGFRRFATDGPTQRFLSARLGGAAAVQVGAITAHRIFVGPRRTGPDNSGAALQPGTQVLRVVAAGESFTIDLAPVISAAADATERHREISAAEAQLPVLGADGALRGSVLILEIDVEETDAGPVVLRLLNAILLVNSPPA